MTITTSCPTCKSLFRLPTEYVGRQVRCQKCENTFLVPEVSPGAMETTAGVSTMPSEASEPPRPPIAKILIAEPVEEVVPTKVAPATPPPSPPIEIVVAEDKQAAAKPAGASAPPLLVPSPAPSTWMGRILLASFIVIGLLVLAWSGGWLSRHLDARRPSVTARSSPQTARATLIELGTDGRATVLGQTRPLDFLRDEERWRHLGPFELYAIHLEQGQTYHFSVSGATISPRLQIFDARFLHADRSSLVPENKLVLAFQAKRTGEHLLNITTSQRMVGDFILSATVQRAAESPHFDLAEQPSVIVNDTLGLEHPLKGVDPNQSSPSREYRVSLERNRNYSISVSSDDFNPRMTIFDRNNQPMEFARPWNQPGNKAHSFPYHPQMTGEYRIRVTGERFGLGAFTLRVSDTSNARPVHSVLVAFQDGLFEDRRSFLASDPNEPGKQGLGPYKEYVVVLKRDQRYRIEMTSEQFGTIVTVNNDRAQQVAGDTNLRNQPLEFTPAFSGQYHIRAIGENRKARGAYQLRIEQLP